MMGGEKKGGRGEEDRGREGREGEGRGFVPGLLRSRQAADWP